MMRSPLFAAVATVVATVLTGAQSPGPQTLDARASDPVTMGWMIGAPPAQDRVIGFSDGSWFRFPQTRWSFSNIRQLMPTKVVSRGDGPTTSLPRAECTDIDAVMFQPIGLYRFDHVGAVSGGELHRRDPDSASRAHRVRALRRWFGRGPAAPCLLGHEVVCGDRCGRPHR